MSSLQLMEESLPLLLLATVSTIELTVLTIALGTALAFPLAIIRESSNKVLSSIVGVYTWIMRASPLLVILYFVYYGLPAVHIFLPAFQIAVVGGGVMSAAYYTEIIRGGLKAVPRGQSEAGKALGLSSWHIWWRIVLPQVIPVALPAFMSNTTVNLKGSSLASVITVNELTGVGNSIISQTFRPLELLFMMAAIYLALNTLLTSFQQWGEHRWAVKR